MDFDSHSEEEKAKKEKMVECPNCAHQFIQEH